jgi:hypothetical protein
MALFSFLFFIQITNYSKLLLTSQRLGAGGASTAARTGTKLANSHKLSGEPLPHLHQTTSLRQALVYAFSLFLFL